MVSRAATLDRKEVQPTAAPTRPGLRRPSIGRVPDASRFLDRSSSRFAISVCPPTAGGQLPSQTQLLLAHPDARRASAFMWARRPKSGLANLQTVRRLLALPLENRYVAALKTFLKRLSRYPSSHCAFIYCRYIAAGSGCQGGSNAGSECERFSKM